MSKEKIIEVAEAIFSEKGITNTKVQEIASRAGMSKKTIYKFFNSKDELIRSVYLKLMEQMNLSMNELVHSNTPFVEKLAGIIYIIRTRLHVITPVLIKDLQNRNPDFHVFFDPYLKNAVFDRFQKLIQSGIEGGSVKPVAKLESVVLMYREAIHGFVYMRSENDIPMNFDRGTPLYLLCQSLSTIFRGILNEEALRSFDDKIKSVQF